MSAISVVDVHVDHDGAVNVPVDAVYNGVNIIAEVKGFWFE